VLTLHAKQFFFDSRKVQRSVDRAKRKELSRAGAFVRRRARSSIRKRKRVSRPGEPPSAHQGDIRKILFAWDPLAESVVVGPLAFNGSGNGNETVPALLEHGGTVVRRGKRGKGKRRKLTYRPRPFMGPALTAEAEKFPRLFRNAVK
jgi:hypothetical protein